MMKASRRWATVAVLVAFAAAGCREGGAGHGTDGLTLGEPEAAYPESFGVVQTVRTMPDGRVLVADPLGQALTLVDMDAGTADTLGSVGEGPDEYQQPDAVWPLPGDKTLLVDLGNARLTELSPELEFGDTHPYVVGELGTGQPFVLVVPSAVDGDGRVYVRSLDLGSRSDSAHVLRVELASGRVDSLARIKVPGTTSTMSGDADNQNTSVVQIPLSPADAWGVAEDGRMVIARTGDYSVEWIAPDGSRTRGAPVDFDPLPVRQGEKEAWQAARSESGGGMSLGVTQSGTSLSMVVSRGGSSNGRELDDYPWPDFLPPIWGGRILVDPTGRAWVRVHTEASAPPAYDLFGPSGEREARMRLLPGRRVVGFDDDKAYVVRMDDLGMQFLERYVLP